MEPLTAVIATGVIAVVLYLIFIFNFARMGRGLADTDKSFDETFKSFGDGFALHVILGGLASLATVALIASSVWLIVTTVS